MASTPNSDVDPSGEIVKSETPEQLALGFGYPDYFGKNWDVYWHCINELEAMPATIRTKGMATLAASFPLEAALLKKRLKDFRAVSRGSSPRAEVA